MSAEKCPAKAFEPRELGEINEKFIYLHKDAESLQ